jgi:hypothetical protein
MEIVHGFPQLLTAILGSSPKITGALAELQGSLDFVMGHKGPVNKD